MKVIKPKKLKKGDTVAIISPSGPVPDELKNQYDRGINFLKILGLNVKVQKNALKKYHYSAGTVEERLSDLHEAFADKKIKAVIMSIGGNSANQLLDKLDFDLIRKNPKIFMGISDGTTLLDPIFSKTGLIAYHGPDLIFTFGLDLSSQVFDNLQNTFFEGKVGELSSNSAWRGLDALNMNHRYDGWHCVRPGRAKGKLIGGNTSCLMNLENTSFRPDYKKAILFLEGYMLSLAQIDAAFTHFRQAKVFNEIGGLVLGHFYGSYHEESKQGASVSDIILETSKDYSFPILEVGEIGHNVENYVMPIGCETFIDAENKVFEIKEDTVI